MAHVALMNLLEEMAAWCGDVMTDTGVLGES